MTLSTDIGRVCQDTYIGQNNKLQVALTLEKKHIQVAIKNPRRNVFFFLFFFFFSYEACQMTIAICTLLNEG